MTDLSGLEACLRQLNSAVQSIVTHENHALLFPTSPRVSQAHANALDSNEPDSARELALASLAKLQIMLSRPADILQQMTLQAQLLACIQWLGEFQILACIPLNGTAVIRDISDLIRVPETQLARIIRVTSLGGFLEEPTPGHVAHSSLSAAFVAKPSYLDAAMFLARTAAPVAQEMAAATKQARDEPHPARPRAPQDVALHHRFFKNADGLELPRLQRQWQAYIRYGLGYHCDTATDILTCLGALPVDAAPVVEVSARSTERVLALANKYPWLQLVVQLGSPHSAPNSSTNKNGPPGPRLRQSRIQVQHRVPGTPQRINNAAVYIINFPIPDPVATWTSLMAELDSELRAHLPVMVERPAAMLVLTIPALPEQGTIREDLGVGSRLRDLSLMQLANEREHDMSEVIGLLSGLGDGKGRLVLVNKVRSGGRDGAVALEIKYQSYPE
ncbi:hypothetical protein BDV10DRAFT_173466 [Aspergillus recurvatus]